MVLPPDEFVNDNHQDLVAAASTETGAIVLGTVGILDTADEPQSHPLSNLTVELWGDDPNDPGTLVRVDSDTSGADGGFFFDVAEGTYTLRVTYLGMDLEETDVFLANGVILPLTLTLYLMAYSHRLSPVKFGLMAMGKGTEKPLNPLARSVTL